MLHCRLGCAMGRRLRRAHRRIHTAGGLSADERYLFDLQGYLVLKAVVPPAEVAAANAAIDRRRAEFVERGVTVRNARTAAWTGPGEYQGRLELGTHLRWPAPDGDLFRRMLAHPALVPKLHDLVGPGYRLDHLPLLLVMRPGAEGDQLHGGNIAHSGVWNRALRYECRGGRLHCDLLALSLALTPTRAGDGGFCVIPGNHKANFPAPQTLQTLEAHEHVLVANSLCNLTLCNPLCPRLPCGESPACTVPGGRTSGGVEHPTQWSAQGAGLLLTTRHHWPPSNIGPNFLLGLWPIKNFLWRLRHQLV